LFKVKLLDSAKALLHAAKT